MHKGCWVATAGDCTTQNHCCDKITSISDHRATRSSPRPTANNKHLSPPPHTHTQRKKSSHGNDALKSLKRQRSGTHLPNHLTQKPHNTRKHPHTTPNRITVEAWRCVRAWEVVFGSLKSAKVRGRFLIWERRFRIALKHDRAWTLGIYYKIPSEGDW